MIGEVLKPHEFNNRNLFGRFLERSKTSNVPIKFGQAEINVVRAVAPELLLPAAAQGVITPDYTEIGFRLVQREFATPDLAYYALLYGKTVSSFKIWDTINNQIEPVSTLFNERNAEYQAFLGRMAERFGCTVEKASELAMTRPITADELQFYRGQVAEIVRILEQATPVEVEAKSLAEFSARAIMTLEAGWIVPVTDTEKTILKALGRKPSREPKPTVADLQDVRAYMEDYFANEQHRSRITLLAQ